MVQSVMVGAQQHQVGQLSGTAVFPVPDVVGVQTSGGATARNHAHAVATLQRATKPPADQAGRTAGTDGLAVTFEPNFTRGIARQESPFGVGEQWTQVQGGSALLNVDVHHHGRVLRVWASRCIGVPAGLDEAHKRLAGGGQRGSLIRVARAIAVIKPPLGDQRITVRSQGGVELRGVMVVKFDPIAAALLGSGRGDQALWLLPRFGFGSRF